MRRAVCLLGSFAVLAIMPGAYAANPDPNIPSYTFKSPAISESSDLLDYGAVNLTTNDSGSKSFLYVVDANTGRTVGRTNYQADVKDVEALAPAGPDEVWVGDIGDNLRKRSTVQIYRVPFARKRLVVQPRVYQLAYPDGPHNAESMIDGPDGRLFIITKAVTGGVVYATPRNLDPSHVNVLTRVAKVKDIATDAALFPDDLYVIVRSYGAATVYTYPKFKQVDSFKLPLQHQGEGISVGPGNRIRLSSEGVHSRVLQIGLPARVSAALGFTAPLPPTTPSATPTTPPPVTLAPATPTTKVDASDDDSSGNGASWLIWAVPVVLIVGAVAIGVGLRRRSS